MKIPWFFKTKFLEIPGFLGFSRLYPVLSKIRFNTIVIPLFHSCILFDDLYFSL